jgi:putative spermidine/putrescine transport system substrate-binding protein
VPNPPKTAQELLDFAKANPGAVQYARPSNSGPGRTLLMGLPYLLSDSDPKDPVKGWDKTWAYLAELNKNITLYPSVPARP